jgi:hypothetical protein
LPADSAAGPTSAFGERTTGMESLRFFLLQHGHLHSLESGGGASYADRVFGGVPDVAMRARPADRLNSLVWLLWHMARTEDAAVNLVVSSGRQVLEDDWARRMNVPWRTIGTGMTDGEVVELTGRADVGAVRAYRAAVGRQTREVVSAPPGRVGRDRGAGRHGPRRRGRRLRAEHPMGRGSGLPAVARPFPRRPARRLRHPAQRGASR